MLFALQDEQIRVWPHPACIAEGFYFKLPEKADGDSRLLIADFKCRVFQLNPSDEGDCVYFADISSLGLVGGEYNLVFQKSGRIISSRLLLRD